MLNVNQFPKTITSVNYRKKKIITHRCLIRPIRDTNILRKLIKSNIKDGIQHIKFFLIITQEM